MDDDGIVGARIAILQFLQHAVTGATIQQTRRDMLAAVDFSPGSKNRLTSHDLGRFAGRTVFERVARAVCRAGCLPRKELFEAWETARRVRRIFRGGRVVDLAGGHGLLAALLLILDDSSPGALVVDTTIPPSAAALWQTIVADWPRLDARIEFVARPIENVAIAATDLVVSVHACGALSDQIIARAVAARARLAILPCCHDRTTCDTGGLEGWMDAALAIDATRARRLVEAGYRVRTQRIPAAITPKNRLLLAEPAVQVTM